jgi:hypothetical protein
MKIPEVRNLNIRGKEYDSFCNRTAKTANFFKKSSIHTPILVNDVTLQGRHDTGNRLLELLE